MKLNDIMAISDSYTDEVVTPTEAIKYVNEALAVINTKLGTELPYFTDVVSSYEALNESWTRRLLVPYMNYSVKMKDASLNEAAEYKQTFLAAFADFQGAYLDVLDDAYLPENISGVYTMDTSAAIDWGWFSGRGGNL